jgi:hypothetical protein
LPHHLIGLSLARYGSAAIRHAVLAHKADVNTDFDGDR